MMMEEDEDIIFDQAALLPGDRSDDEIISVTHTARTPDRVLVTVCLCLAFFALGLCIAIPGPTLLDLQEQTNTDTEQISRIFTGRSVGYLVGSVVGGFLFDRINQSCLLSFSLFLTAVATAAAPWCKNFILLMAILAFQGVSMGFLDTGGNVLCLYTWGHSSGPYMQAMHCLFGVGAFVAPLIAEPFLSHRMNMTNYTEIPESTTLTLPLDKRDADDWLAKLVQHDHRERRDAIDTTPLTTPSPRPTKPKVADAKHLNADPKFADGSQLSHDLKKMEKQQKLDTGPPTVTPSTATSNKSEMLNTTIATTSMTTTPATTPTTTTPILASHAPKTAENQTTPPSTNKTYDALEDLKQRVSHIITVIYSLSKVQFAYLLIASTVLLVSALFAIACCRAGLHLRATRNDDAEAGGMAVQESIGFRIQILALLFLFYFLYVGMEVTFGGLAMTFSVTFLGWSKTRGSLLTSTFWGAFATARGFAILLARCLTPPVMLITDLIIVIFALIGLVMASESSDVVVWLCSALLGAGMASIFPTGITWAGRYMHVTGKSTSVFVVGSALGEMLMPALAGFLFEVKGPMWLLYILLGASVFSIIIYIIMQNLATNMGIRYDRLDVSAEYHRHLTVNSGMELDALTPTSSTYSDDWSLQRRKRVTFDLNSCHDDDKQSNGNVIPATNGSTNGDLGSGGAPKHSILKCKVDNKAG